MKTKANRAEQAKPKRRGGEMTLSELQTVKLTKKFELLDVDGNGTVERADIERVIDGLAEMRGWAKESAERAELKERHAKLWHTLATFCDTNDDGKVALDEWLSYHAEAIRADQEELRSLEGYESTLQALSDFFFDLLDADGDGMVGARDYAQFCEVLGVEEGAASMGRLDRNNDGKLSRSEMTSLIIEFYQSSDPTAPGNWFFGVFDTKD